MKSFSSHDSIHFDSSRTGNLATASQSVPYHSPYVIDAQRLTRVYRSPAGNTYALRGVTLRVKQGEFLAIMGSSGSGKSTLMSILGCLDTATSGSYYLEGEDIKTKTDDELASIRATRIGFVFQSFNLLPRVSVIRNVMLPLLYTACPVRERIPRARAALRAVSIDEKLFDHMSNELSGGQVQRVAIARALVNSPALILADEPTGNLDSETTDQVLSSFESLHRAGRTIVLITHESDVASRADRCVYIKDGCLYDSVAAMHNARKVV